jgi:hypothetical protein
VLVHGEMLNLMLVGKGLHMVVQLVLLLLHVVLMLLDGTMLLLLVLAFVGL